MCLKKSVLLMACLGVTAASVALAIEVPVVWFEDDFESYPEGTRLRDAAPKWGYGTGPENKILPFGGDQAVRLKGDSGNNNNSDALNVDNWADQSAGKFQILTFTLQSDLDYQSNVGNHLYIELNDSTGDEMGRWFGWSHAVTPRFDSTLGPSVNITDGELHDFAITYDPETGDMQWLHNDAVQWTQNIGAGLASERVYVKDWNRDANDYVWLDDVVAGTVFAGLTWDGGPGSWASANWSGGKPPVTGIDMVVDAASGDSDVTVDADFNSALSLAIGQHNTARVAVSPSVTLTVDNEVSVGANGTLSVDGTLAAGNLVSDGTLSGNGTIVANVLANGILAPGNSPGVLTVQGGFELGDSATYQCEIGQWDSDNVPDPWGEDPPIMVNDKVDVVGNDAYLSGTLELLPLDKLSPPHLIDGRLKQWYGDQTRTILTTSGENTARYWFETIPQAQPESYAPDYSNWDQGHLGFGVFLTRKTNTMGDDDPDDLLPDQPGISYTDNATLVHLFQGADGDTNGDRVVNSRDIQRILAQNLFMQDVDADWTQGDFTGDQRVTSVDIQAVLAANLFGQPPYASMDPGEPGDGTVDLVLDVNTGLLTCDPDGELLNGYIITSAGAVFTGEEAANQGVFTVDEDYEISGQFGFVATEAWDLGHVVGTEFLRMPLDFYEQDLTCTYTRQGDWGVYNATLILIPEPGTVVLLITGALAVLVWGTHRRRRVA